eukprot:707_1
MAMVVDKDSNPPNDNMDNEETAAGNDLVSHLLTSTNQEIALSKMHSTHTPHQYVEPQSNASYLYVPRKWFILLIILVILSIGLSVASLVYSFSHDHKCMCPHAPLPSAAQPTLANTTTGTVTKSTNTTILITATSNNITSHTSQVTAQPSQSPVTLQPSQVTTQPSQSPVTVQPSEVTAQPSQSPVTAQPSAYAYAQNFVGDYKMSALSKSHENWLLCDGSFLDPREYEELFGVIGYSFGSKKSTSEYVHSGSNYGLLVRFALPSAGDRVVGINGNTHNIGERTGTDSISLREEHIPAHSHSLYILSHSSQTTGRGDHLTSSWQPYRVNTSKV